MIKDQLNLHASFVNILPIDINKKDMTANYQSTALLQRLAGLNLLQVNQEFELLEIVTGFETNNKYQVLDSSNQLLFLATEQTSCCMRYWCGAARSFAINLKDNRGADIMCVRRGMKCRCGPCCSCLECCQEEIVVECPPGNPIGFARQNAGCSALSIDLLDTHENKIMELRRDGSCAHCACPSFCCCWHQDIEYKLMCANGNTEIGNLTRVFTSYWQDLATDADNFRLTFPADMQVEAKALFLGVTFLIDFMYFEHSDDKNK